MKRRAVVMTVALLAALLTVAFGPGTTPTSVSAAGSQYFPQTNRTVSGKFLDYWQNNGGLAAFGYPISDAQMEFDTETGKEYLTQWFERNRFELHPENAGTKYEVLLGLLSKRLTQNRPVNDPSFQPTAAKQGFYYFPQTRHNVSSLFYSYWQNNGSLDRLGYPLDEEQQETDPATGKIYLIQWFERARLEYHPENQAPYNVLLGLLGSEVRNTSPDGTLRLFYQSINNKTYRQAYNYWDTPAQSLPAYNQWVAGYATTRSVSLTLGQYQTDAGAGNLYAAIPVVLTAIHTDGPTQTFFGCYIMHKINIENDQVWHISRANIQQAAPGNRPNDPLQAAQGICTNL